MNQNEPKRSYANPELATAIHEHFFLTMSTIRQVLTIPLLTKDALFVEHFEDEFHFLSIC